MMRARAHTWSWVIFAAALAAGCGGGGGDDADGGVDGQNAGATVTVKHDFELKAGAVVFAHDSSGAVVGAPATTDASGVASVNVPAGGALTVASEADYTGGTGTGTVSRWLVTYLGVANTDDLDVIIDDTYARRELTINYPGNPPATTPSVEVTYVAGWRDTVKAWPPAQRVVEVFPVWYDSAGKVPVLSLALGADEGYPIAYAFADLAVLANGGTINHASWTAMVQPDGGGLCNGGACSRVRIKQTNLPGAATQSLVATESWRNGRRIDEHRFTSSGAIESSQRFVPVPGAFPTATSVYALADVSVSLSPAGTARTLSPRLMHRIGQAGATDQVVTIDLATSLPTLTSATLNYSNKAAILYAWTTDAAMPAAVDGGRVTLFWSKTVGTVTYEYYWNFVFPGGQTSLTTPALPASLADWSPASSLEDTPDVFGPTFVDSSALSDYAAYRATPYPLRPDSATTTVRATALTTGAIRPL